MDIHRNCIVCILNQLLRAADFLKLEEGQKDVIMQTALKRAASVSYSDITAPEYAEGFYQIVMDVSGEPDPYKTLRYEQNRMVMESIDLFRERIKKSPDSLLAAGYYALLGNIIDYGGVHVFDSAELFRQCGRMDITVNDYDAFAKRLRDAKRLLILADNAGEAVFDKLFIEEMKAFNPELQVDYGVRSKPAINDVIKEDAEYIGIHEVANVFETGSSYAGTIPPRSTATFKKIYENADIVISKGQGNYETLETEEKNILFIFKVKCDVVAKHAGLPLGSLVFAFNKTLKQAPKVQKREESV
ncbi:MAG: DUF89 family protein [bacterium]|nr:DUF89 family protein [bacterium]